MTHLKQHSKTTYRYRSGYTGLVTEVEISYRQGFNRIVHIESAAYEAEETGR